MPRTLRRRRPFLAVLQTFSLGRVFWKRLIGTSVPLSRRSWTRRGTTPVAKKLPTTGALASSNLATVDYVAQAVQAGAADVGVVWDTTVKSNAYRASLEAVETAPFRAANARIAMGVLATSRHQDEALRYARYLAGEEGAAVLAAHGFTAIGRAER